MNNLQKYEKKKKGDKNNGNEMQDHTFVITSFCRSVFAKVNFYFFPKLNSIRLSKNVLWI